MLQNESKQCGGQHDCTFVKGKRKIGHEEREKCF